MRQHLQRIKRVGEAHATLQVVAVTTCSAERTITLPDDAMAGLRAIRRRQNEARLQRGDAWDASGFVFTSGDGPSVEPSNLIRGFRALLKAAALNAIRFHEVRHSCASLLRAGGAPAHVVQAMLGHSDIRVTLGT